MKAFSACYCVDSFEQWTLDGLPVHPLLRIFVAMTTHTSSWAVLWPGPFIPYNAKIVMATTPIHAHHMLGKKDVHIWTSVSRWWHCRVCWVGGKGGWGWREGKEGCPWMQSAAKCVDGVGVNRRVHTERKRMYRSDYVCTYVRMLQEERDKQYQSKVTEQNAAAIEEQPTCRMKVDE